MTRILPKCSRMTRRNSSSRRSSKLLPWRDSDWYDLGTRKRGVAQPNSKGVEVATARGSKRRGKKSAGGGLGHVSQAARRAEQGKRQWFKIDDGESAILRVVD